MQFSRPGPCTCPDAKRASYLAALSILLSYQQLGPIGMAHLKDLLSSLIPDLEISE